MNETLPQNSIDNDGIKKLQYTSVCSLLPVFKY